MKINKYSDTMPDEEAANLTCALKDSRETRVITTDGKKLSRNLKKWRKN